MKPGGNKSAPVLPRMTEVQREAARCIERGWQPVPIPKGLKGPRSRDWQSRRLALADIPREFPPGFNSGLHTGDASGGLVDVDLDCETAVKLAPRLLPPTEMRHGRPGNRDSHWWYQIENWDSIGATLTVETFKHPITRAMLVELRGNNHQTLIPPSFNDEIEEDGNQMPGELLAWETPAGEPSSHRLDVMQEAVRRLAAAAVLCEYWKPTTRHDASLAISGWLLRDGVAPDTVETLLGAMAFAVGANEKKVRSAVRDTARNLEANRKVTGRTTLISEFGYPLAVLERVEEWLGVVAPATVSALAGSTSDPPVSWPSPLSEYALYGLAGKIVRALGPHTEADDANLLGHLLTMFGNAVGRSPYIEADGAAHHANIFSALVGDTSGGRKGTGKDQTLNVVRRANPEWASRCISTGLSSGEGLIWSVRDAIYKPEPIKGKAKGTEYRDVMIDKGVTDKRLLVIETEFAQPLRMMRREGNVLSTVIRLAWDSGPGPLQVLTKNSPAKATGPHISIVGHITRHELVRSLAAADIAAGFAPRFLWFAVRKSKNLPHGGNLDEQQMLPLSKALAEALAAASTIRRVGWSKSAYKGWEKIYPIAQDGPGLFRIVTSRADPQVLRLALIYALLDKSDLIEDVHLRAALSLWMYCEESARYIFGGAIGYSDADRILDAVRSLPAGKTRTEINSLFGGHKPSTEIDEAIKVLARAGRVRVSKQATGGRAQERVVPL